ncbi:MAG: hypothetical protein ACRDN0_14655 [Trebonia sp.]
MANEELNGRVKIIAIFPLFDEAAADEPVDAGAAALADDEPAALDEDELDDPQPATASAPPSSATPASHFAFGVLMT